MRQAHEFLQAKGAKLKFTDFKHTVEVSHQDGSHFLLHNAIMKEKEFDDHSMLLVWTEHCGYFAFFVCDLEFWRKYKAVK